MASANALALGDGRWKLARPICGTYGKHFAKRGFGFFLLPSRAECVNDLRQLF
jgi:hypothetical protein